MSIRAVYRDSTSLSVCQKCKECHSRAADKYKKVLNILAVNGGFQRSGNCDSCVRDQSGWVDKKIPTTTVTLSLFGLVRILQVEITVRWMDEGSGSGFVDCGFCHFSSILLITFINMHATCISPSPSAAQHIRAFLAWNHDPASSVSRVSTPRLSCCVHCFGFGSSIEVPPWLACGKWQERCGLPERVLECGEREGMECDGGHPKDYTSDVQD